MLRDASVTFRDPVEWSFRVDDTRQPVPGFVVHIGEMFKGSARVNDTAVALVDSGAVAVVVSDSVALAESVALVVSTSIAVSDNVGAAESATVAIATMIVVSDALAVADAPAALLVSLVGASDAITVSDAPTVVMPDPLLISVSQSNTVNELVTVVIVGLVSVPVFMASYRRRRV